MAMSVSGILFLDKPEGLTSRQVDNAFQKLFHTPKVGHLGTLDPFATGLLIIAVNSATKYLNFLPDEEKTYEATLCLGKATDTGDKTGQFTQEVAVPALDKVKVEEVLSSFLGQGMQVPPMTSAIKVDGTALYRLAHKGEEVARKARPITIHALELLELEPTKIRFRCTVSKGTYVRVLGEDIAKALGTVGYLEQLRRTRVGTLRVEDAVSLDSATEKDLKNPSDYLTYPSIEVDEQLAKKVTNGAKLQLDSNESRIVLRFRGKALAIYEKDGGIYRCLRGLEAWK